MFQTFRQRLLFWFLILISFNLVILAHTNRYLNERQKILETTELIESAYLLLLKNVTVKQDFFSYETTNPIFFKTGESNYLQQYKALEDSLNRTIDRLQHTRKAADFEVHTSLHTLSQRLQLSDSLFTRLIELIHKRGYKDYTLEGAMRVSAHRLESFTELNQTDVLSLRRHEKDYIIRNEQSYVDKLNLLGEDIKKRILKNNNRPADSIVYYLDTYLKYFNEIVTLDREIGIRDNKGLKYQLDQQLSSLESVLQQAVKQAKVTEQSLIETLSFYYVGITVLLLLLSLGISYLIARKITKPLTDLTVYITRFVDSNFSFEEGNPVVRTKDEIGKLTQNFTVLKTEIIGQLKFFKQKVDERTAELATANQKLVKVNEANSRFVPNEFLQFLGRKTVEEIQLGDHVEREMTVMFTDIRGFTQLSEKFNPEENFDFINSYLHQIVPVIRNHNGFIDKFMGDSVMALFPGKTDDAFAAALEITGVVSDFNKEFLARGKEPIKVGTGIHRGNLILGTIGHEHRLETTVISDAVNIASRLEGLTKHYHSSIIVSENSIQALEQAEKFHYRFLDNVKVKGKTKSVSVYEIISSLEPWKLETLELFNEGVQLLKERQLEIARKLFAHLIHQSPQDGAAKIFLKRCEEYILKGLPDEWDGIEVMQSK